MCPCARTQITNQQCKTKQNIYLKVSQRECEWKDLKKNINNPTYVGIKQLQNQTSEAQPSKPAHYTIINTQIPTPLIISMHNMGNKYRNRLNKLRIHKNKVTLHGLPSRRLGYCWKTENIKPIFSFSLEIYINTYIEDLERG